MSEARTDTYQRITDTIVEALEAGTRPWMKPWSAQNIGGTFPRPVRSTGEPYRGINVLLLWIASAAHGFQFDRFMTYKQAQGLGGQVRKGEKGTTIVKYGTITRTVDNGRGEDEDREIPYLKGYTVFNVSQIEDLPGDYYQTPAILPEEQRIEGAELFIANTGANIRHEGDKACYIPATDLIRMPPFRAFENAEAYYATLFHETSHWCGAKSRLDRIKSTDMRTQDYAFEELVAEISACFLCSDLSITAKVRPESASYIAGWLKALKQDKRLIFKAASKAQAAADYLHSLQENRAAA
ncbi:zincin-like metallopeptidase domain-containing protein [Rhizobium sp. 1399]|uniref:ArdC family protein n=1 Tax=Rhizobium sp. 1399 TaxID=2817758 RepID=UPI00285DC9E3|nr:zincin-like metallopeptidase domain-containing protein [Rhizobium sp. 1399]MDR6671199.1 antirestriction protein ArdC [Rhizobium sp. 1399]